jgi:hypothetical protein
MSCVYVWLVMPSPVPSMTFPGIMDVIVRNMMRILLRRMLQRSRTCNVIRNRALNVARIFVKQVVVII